MLRNTTKRLLVVLAVLAATAPAWGQSVFTKPPRGYRKVSSLVNLPNFLPGMGVLYVRPETLPNGPFLAYDRRGRLVSTIYMIPLQEMNDRKKWELGGLSAHGDHTTFYFNSGHPGVDMPHYHYVVWHVSRRNEARVAK